MSDSLTCHYYHRCICIVFFFSFFFPDDTDADDFWISFDVVEFGSLGFLFFPLPLFTEEGEDPLSPLPQPSICECPCSPAIAPNSLSPASSTLSCAGLDMLCCALWHHCLIFYCFHCVLGVVEGSKKQTEARECQSMMIVERTSVNWNILQ